MPPKAPPPIKKIKNPTKPKEYKPTLPPIKVPAWALVYA